MAAPKLMTADEYLRTPETVVPAELRFGALRVAESPTPRHQSAVARIVRALDGYVGARGIGEVWLAPLDVILDEERALIVQPDLMFIAQRQRVDCQGPSARCTGPDGGSAVAESTDWQNGRTNRVVCGIRCARMLARSPRSPRGHGHYVREPPHRNASNCRAAPRHRISHIPGVWGKLRGHPRAMTRRRQSLKMRSSGRSRSGSSVVVNTSCASRESSVGRSKRSLLRR